LYRFSLSYVYFSLVFAEQKAIPLVPVSVLTNNTGTTNHAVSSPLEHIGWGILVSWRNLSFCLEPEAQFRPYQSRWILDGDDATLDQSRPALSRDLTF